MDRTTVIDTLGRLAQPTRLETFRLLMAAEPDGLAAGEIAHSLGIPHNTLSNHLAILTRAFAETYRMLRNRIIAFVNLPMASLDRLSLQKHLVNIGKS